MNPKIAKINTEIDKTKAKIAEFQARLRELDRQKTEIENTEMYGEHFDIPVPDELVFISWFPGGEVFRSGCCFNRGNGRVFYFRPGHETHPIYHNEEVLRVILNAIKWAAPSGGPQFRRGNVPPLERI